MKRWRESLLFHPMLLRQLRRRPVSRMSAEDVVVAGPPTAPWSVCLQRKMTLEPGWLRTRVTQVTIQMVQTLRHASSDILEIKCAILPDRRYEEVRPIPELWKSSVSFNFGRATHFFLVCYSACLPYNSADQSNSSGKRHRDNASNRQRTGTASHVKGQQRCSILALLSRAFSVQGLSGTSGTDCSANSARAVPAQCPHGARTVPTTVPARCPPEEHAYSNSVL